MTCVICKRGTPVLGVDTTSFTRGPITVVVRDVPADVCPDCGEAYYDVATTERLLELVDSTIPSAARTKGGVAVLEFAAA